ncbi:MAG: hypothetical protein IJH76_03510 [Clostridia bacterium]|nr:hypothetical protein [Clostridia bacterium]
MQKKKENFLDKVIKKNYNNELEHVLEHKDFDVNTKNILLSILYKLETAYSDYEKVKCDVYSKDEYLQNFIECIDKNINSITLVKMDSEEASILGKKTFIIDKEKKHIICYTIELKLLYAISKISKKETIIKDKYFVVNKTISDLLNVGNNINKVEPIRDFNGFSWSVIAKDIPSIEHNLVYQNLSILFGNDFLNKWIHNNEFIIDYYEIFMNKLEDLYGKQIKQEFIDSLSKISVMLEAKYSKENIEDIVNKKREIAEKLQEINYKQAFIKELTIEKKDINKHIKKLDTIISDKKLLQQEYAKRNDELPLDKKIFSMKVLSRMLKDERLQLITQKEEINKLLNPQKFIKYEKELEDRYKFIKYIESSNLEKDLKKEIIKFEIILLICFKQKIKNVQTVDELIRLIIQYRYYLNIPIDKKQKVSEEKALQSEICEIQKMLINKAIKAKIIVQVSTNEEMNFSVLKEIFNSKIINIRNINIELKKEEEKVYLQIFDEEIFDAKIDLGTLSNIDTKSLKIRFNKEIKLFNY